MIPCNFLVPWNYKVYSILRHLNIVALFWNSLFIFDHGQTPPPPAAGCVTLAALEAPGQWAGAHLPLHVGAPHPQH